jgi:DNA topoisomerase-1
LIYEALKLNIDKLNLEQNFTKPPARYTEASLVKKMEAEGIGRPSTYAPTIATIQAREYVIKTEDKKLKPTLIGTVVNDFLVEHFKNIVNLGFTAYVEEEFDKIALGKMAWTEVLREFYDPFAKTIEDKLQNAPRVQFSEIKELGIDPKTNKIVTARVGQYGPYVQLGTKDDDQKPKIASIPNNISINDITLDEALTLLTLPKILGQTEQGEDIKVNIGRFGPYLQIKSEYFSLKTDNPYTIELPRALEIIKEQREQKAKALIKDFPQEDTQILIGRYGPYIKSKKKNYKLPKDLSDEEIRNLTFEQVKQIIKNQPQAKKKTTRKRKTNNAKK